MSERQSNIESELAAYIDGLLDAQQRDQIEQYLDHYPEHRQLIDRLMQERALLRDLPRESAPADVLAHFQDQLERSVLLDDFSAKPSGAVRGVRRKRWNLAAILALLMLAGGISVIVWIAMPPQRVRQSTTVFPSEPAPASSVVPDNTATQPATNSVVSMPTPTMPATNPTPSPRTIASVVQAGDRIVLMVLTDDLPAARNRADHFLKIHSLSRPPTNRSTTLPATTQSSSPTPASTDTAWVISGMTLGQANELARWFSTMPTTYPATAPATQTTRPTTQPPPATQPSTEVIILFKNLNFPAPSAPKSAT